MDFQKICLTHIRGWDLWYCENEKNPPTGGLFVIEQLLDYAFVL